MKFHTLTLVTTVLQTTISLHAGPVTPTASGRFTLPEISGAAFLGDHLLVVADDLDKSGHMIDLLQNAPCRLTQPSDIQTQPLLESIKGYLKSDKITDLEDIAPAPNGGPVYLIGSHSLSKLEYGPDGKPEANPSTDPKEKRKRLLRLTFTPQGQVESASFLEVKLRDKVPADLKPSLSMRPGEVTDGSHTPGFNIEGLAWTPGKFETSTGDLLVGLRSPLQGQNAVLLRLQNPDSGEAATLTAEAEIDLGGLGIRGLCWDAGRNGHWILAGNAPDPDPKAPISQPSLTPAWAVYFRNQTGVLNRQFTSAELSTTEPLNPEAITLLPGSPSDRLLIISDDDAERPSRYVTVSISCTMPEQKKEE